MCVIIVDAQCLYFEGTRQKVLDTSSVNSFVLKMNLFFKIGLRNPLGMEHVLKMINLPMLVIIILQ